MVISGVEEGERENIIKGRNRDTGFDWFLSKIYSEFPAWLITGIKYDKRIKILPKYD